MKWILIGWLFANAALIVAGLVIVFGSGVADQRLGGVFPLMIAGVSSAVWLVVLLVWLLVH